jgi:predicted N-acetyltransferase YhbS
MKLEKEEQVLIRVMNPDDLPAAMQLVESVGWNQTERDLRLFLEGPGNIYLAAEIDGRVVGTVASINYGRRLAWISMMIVAETCRGRGIGKQLLQTLIGRLQAAGYRTIKLDATPEGRPVYRKLGFREEYEIHRLVRDGRPELDLSSSPNPGIRFLTPDDRSALIAMDRATFGADRAVLLTHLLDETPALGLVRENRLVAFTCGRRGRRFYQVGPVAGDTLRDVRSVLSFFLKQHSESSFVMDVLAEQAPLLHWLESLGFIPQRSFYRMFLHENRMPGQPERQFCIAGPEFG